jgi:hypothetical protein
MRAIPITVLNAGAETSATFEAIDVNQWFNVTAQVSFSDAAAAGTLKLQGSLDAPAAANLADDTTPTNWSDIPSASVVVAAGATSVIEKPDLNYMYLRVVWTRSAGAGTMTVKVKGQSV